MMISKPKRLGDACQYVGVPLTSRQIRKFVKGRGIAFRSTLGHIVIPTDVTDRQERFAIANSQLSRSDVFNG